MRFRISSDTVRQSIQLWTARKCSKAEASGTICDTLHQRFRLRRQESVRKRQASEHFCNAAWHKRRKCSKVMDLRANGGIVRHNIRF